MRRLGFGHAVLIAVGLAGAGLYAAQQPVPAPPAPKADSRTCLECHPGSSLTGSAHATLTCRDCHQGIVSLLGEIPHQRTKDMPLPTCTAACHKESDLTKPGESPVTYADSVHGRAYLERGNQDVAKCWDCHGRHNIKSIADPDSAVSRKNIPLICSRCHENMNVVLKYNIHAESPYQEYKQSVHGRALFEKGLVSFAAVCTDCHGVHTIQGVGEPNLQAKQPTTCGKCHELILNEYKDSVHGQEAFKGNSDVPLCVDCHGEHKVGEVGAVGSRTSKKNIPDTCSGCHARPEIMKKYGVPEDRIQTFIESFHGIAIGLGDKAEAGCTDCHGVHDIRKAADPKSTVNPANLAKTCSQANCHPGMPAKIASAKIHIDVNAKKSGAPYYVQKILLWIVILSVGLTLVWFLPVLFRKMNLSKKR